MELGIKDLVDFARGAAFFGAGGGGDPYVGRLMLEQQLAAGSELSIIELDNLNDDAFVVTVAVMGAPTVMTEKLPSIGALENTLRHMERITNKKVTAIIPLEIGGINSTLPLVLAAKIGIPVINADGMGRAFPEIQMVTHGVYGCDISPVVVANEAGDMVTVQSTDNKKGEDFSRAVAARMGGQAQICCYPMSGKLIKETAVRNTLSLALEIGRSIRRSREQGSDPFTYLFEQLQISDAKRAAKILFDGKIVDIERQTRNGFNYGTIHLEGIEGVKGRFEIEFQNENIVAYHDGHTVAVVPDLIIIMDRETAEPLTTESVKYGQRVKIIGLSVPEVMTSPEALAVFGPRPFGLDEDYRSISELASQSN